MTKPKRKPRPLPTKKERDGCPLCGKDISGHTLANPHSCQWGTFVRPMGVPCVDLQPPKVDPFRRGETRYLLSKGLFWLARTIRRLAWKVAPK